VRLIAALPVPLFIIDSCPFGRARTASAEVEPQYDEQIAEVTGRLRQRYPRDPISPADLQDRVRGFHRQFDTARIRTFVAVFVERLVQRSIEQPPVGKAGGGPAQPQG